MFSYTNYKIKNFLTQIVCLLIWFKNKIAGRELHVKHISYSNNIVMQGNLTDVIWEAKGCHKIVINKSQSLPGHTSQIVVKLTNKINKLEIKFFGVNGQNKTKRIVLKTSNPEVLNTFTPITNFSNLNATTLPLYYKAKNIQSRITSPKISIQKLKINLPHL